MIYAFSVLKKTRANCEGREGQRNMEELTAVGGNQGDKRAPWIVGSWIRSQSRRRTSMGT